MPVNRVIIYTHEFPPYVGGVGTYCVEIGRAAIALGLEVTIVAPSYGEDTADLDASFPFAVQRFAAHSYRALSLPSLADLIRRNYARFDLVVLADWPFIIAARLLFWLDLSRKFRVILHGTDALILAQGRLPKALVAGRVLAQVQKVIANSRYTLAVARREHPAITDELAAVALLGVDSYWFEPADGIDLLRSSLGIPPDRQIILSVSRLDERKGHRHMLEALSRLTSEQKAQAVYVVVGKSGSASYEAELRAKAQGIGLPVVFTGALPRDDVRRLYAGATAFMLLGEERRDKIEGFGLVYLEAAAQGVPSIASPVGGVPEVVLHQQTGLLADYRDPEGVAGTIAFLLHDAATRRRLGGAAREWARGFTWRRCAELTLADG